jgi:hypothetical protein
MQLGSAHHVALERRDQRIEKPRRLTHPGGQRGAGQLDAAALVDPLLSVERRVIRILGGDHLRE